jgi:hypothetical protein
MQWEPRRSRLLVRWPWFRLSCSLRVDHGSQDQECRCHRSFRWPENTRSTHYARPDTDGIGRQTRHYVPTTSEYENGSNRISAGRLKRIAEILEVPVSFFFQGASGNDAATNNINEGFSFLETAASVRLVRAFTDIENQNIRSSIVTLVEGIANSQRGRRK